MSVDDPRAPRPAQAGLGLTPGGTLNDRYQIDEALPAGPYGSLYRARDLADGRLVTIKTLAPQLIADGRVRQRLEREIQLAMGLEHKNIGATYGLFGAVVGGEPLAYLACEYVDGQTLRDMIDKKRESGRTFSLKGTYNVVAHLCNALIHAHATLVHGGLTPHAVVVNSAGRVKVIDFGLARVLTPLENFLAQVGAGSLASLPPEMATAPDAVDGRADLYSVGAILFELLTGRPPSEGFTPPSRLVSGVPRSVDEVVERAMRPLPEERFASAQALKEAVQATLAHETDGEAARPASSRASAPRAAVAPPGPVAAPRAAVAPRGPISAPRAAVAAPPQTPVPPPMRAPTPAPASRAPQPKASDAVNIDTPSSDDQSEHWLIQKDRLDFGPFSLQEVRSQIEAGKIRGEHTIVDTDSGERRKVKDHPLLRQLVLTAEASLAEKQREESELADRRKQRGRVVGLLSIILLIVLGGGGGVAWYVMHMKPKVVEKVVHADDDWLKGIEITMKVDPKEPKKTHDRSRHHRRNGKWDDSQTLGDASEGGGDETLDQSVVQQVMTKNFRVLVPCISEERHRNSGLHAVEMDFIIKGSGQVAAVKVNGQSGSSLASCMYGKMQAVAFPKFDGAKTHASFSLALR